MAKRGYCALGIVAFAILALLPVASSADSNARIVRLSDVEGSVQIDRNTGHGFEKAVQNMPITQGVRIETGMSGRAEVEFENGSVLRLAGQTSAEFSKLSLRSNGDQSSEIRINDGTAYVNYRRKGESDFRLWAGNRAIDLEKDVRLRLSVSGGQAEIAVFKGELKFQGPTESAKVKKNETLTLDLNNGAGYELAKGITPAPADDYNQEREQYLDQYASSRTYGNSPYAYGYSDLNRYGSFFYAPGYGTLWRPTGFGPGWDPFMDGYWSFYPGYGYVWVSGYQWGWTPYRFGSWTFVPAYGWCWQPGGWNTWNTGIRVVNPPAGWRNPAPPPTGAGGTTVVVGQPRGPRSPRMMEADDMVPPSGRSRPVPVTAVPGRPTAQPGTPVQNSPTATTSAPVATQPARSAPNGSTKALPENDVRGEPAARKGGERPVPAPGAAASAPSRQMSAPPAAAPAAPRPAPTPRVERSAPSPAPRMEAPPMRSAPPTTHSGGGHPSKTSPK